MAKFNRNTQFDSRETPDDLYIEDDDDDEDL